MVSGLCRDMPMRPYSPDVSVASAAGASPCLALYTPRVGGGAGATHAPRRHCWSRGLHSVGLGGLISVGLGASSAPTFQPRQRPTSTPADFVGEITAIPEQCFTGQEWDSLMAVPRVFVPCEVRWMMDACVLFAALCSNMQLLFC
jgi:hypothetical protein